MYFDIDNVANPEVLETMKELSVCSICTGLVIDPKQCDKCENAFCRICVEAWLKKNKSCPFKCESPAFKEAGRALKTMINKLMLKCPMGCPKTFGYENLKSHICEKKEIVFADCPCCGSKVPDSQIKPINNEEFLKKIKLIEEENKNLWQENVKLKFLIEESGKDKNFGQSIIQNININQNPDLIRQKMMIEEEEKKKEKMMNEKNLVIEKNIRSTNLVDEKNMKENIFVEKRGGRGGRRGGYKNNLNSRGEGDDLMKSEVIERKKREPLEYIDPKDLPCKHRCKRNLTKGMTFLFPCCGKLFECKRCHNEVSDHYNVRANFVICTKCNTQNNVKLSKCEKCSAFLFIEQNVRQSKH